MNLRMFLLPAMAILLTSCETVSPELYQLTRMSDGRFTRLTLGEPGHGYEKVFEVVPINVSGSLTYPTQSACNYSVRYAPQFGGNGREMNGRITINRHNRSLLTYVEIGDAVSTSSIDPRGSFEQFNITLLDGSTVRSRTRSADAASLRSVNQALLTLPSLNLLPEYRSGPWRPGDVVATLHDAAGAIVGRYEYLGVVVDGATSAGRRPTAALQIIPTTDTLVDPIGPRRYSGYLLISTNNMMPQSYYFRDADGSYVSLSSRGCQP